jgi:biopolymer transport protein ExbB
MKHKTEIVMDERLAPLAMRPCPLLASGRRFPPRLVPLVAVVALALISHGVFVATAAGQALPADEPPVAIPQSTFSPAAGPIAPVANDSPIPTKSLWDMLMAGGLLMIPLFACSFLLLLIVFERSVMLRPRRIIPKPFVKRFLLQLREGRLDRDSALTLCEENPSYVAKVLAAAVRRWGRPAVEVEQAILDEGERAANALRRYLRVINGIATVSPLLGLLGTVWGMIEAFNSIATVEAMGRPEMLAGGIAHALITTAAGLVVAIPALIFYLLFIGRVDQLVMKLDATGQEVVNIISAEAIQEARTSKPPRKGQAA